MVRSRRLECLNAFGRTTIIVPRTLLALDILCYLGNRTSLRAPSAEISADLNITVPYTRKIGNQLIEAGFVQSVRGRDGGLRLARPPNSILLGEVVRYFDQQRQSNLPESKGSEYFDCVMVEARERFLEILNEHSLAELLTWTSSGAMALTGRKRVTSAAGRNPQPPSRLAQRDGPPSSIAMCGVS